MNNIDYDKYDVSCFTATPHSYEVLKNMGKVNKNVRFLFKPGLPVYNILEVYKDKFIHNRGKRGFLGRSFTRKMPILESMHVYSAKQSLILLSILAVIAIIGLNICLRRMRKRKFVICIMICFLIVNASLTERDLTGLI